MNQLSKSFNIQSSGFKIIKSDSLLYSYQQLYPYTTDLALKLKLSVPVEIGWSI